MAGQYSSKSTPIQNSFHTGELSPKIYGRTDSDGYKSGAEIMENFIADPRGPAYRRLGSRYITEFAGNDGRVFVFAVNQNAGYIIVMTGNKMFPITMDGVALPTNFVYNPRFRSGSIGWTVDDNNGDAIFYPDLLVMRTNDSAQRHVYVGQQVTVPSAGTYRVAVTELLGKPYVIRVGTALNNSAYGEIIVATGGPINAPITLPATTAWITVVNEERDSVINVTSIGITSTTVDNSIDTPWIEQDLENLHVAIAPSGSVAYIMHPNYPVHKLTYTYATDSFEFEQVTFTGTPPQWTGQNHPRTGVFHEGRFWLGGTPNESQTFWASQSGLYEDFTLGAEADDGLVFTMAKQGDIRWMASTKNLMIGTTFGEHIVTSVEGVITPSDIQVTQQSAYGSNTIQSVQVGDQIFYVSADETKVRAMQYEFAADNWLSKDVTFFSSHITESGIRNVAWAQNPNNQFACLLRNGTLAVCSYERGEDLWGWHRHNLGGEIKDIAAGPLRGLDISVSLNRRVPGKIYLEVYPQLQEVYMDSWITRSGTQMTQIDNINHLEGKEVNILTDDAVHPNRVVTGGSVTLDWPADQVYIGLPYTSTLRTLPPDTGVSGGSAVPYMKRFNRIYVNLLDSANPKINGERQPSRTASTPMDTRQPNITAISLVGERGWDRKGQITIEQDLPLPCTILNLSAEFNQEII